jgi:hypothetical protein
MDSLLAKIIEPGESYTTSTEIRNIVTTIVTASHHDIYTYIVKTHPDVKVSKTKGGNLAFPKYHFKGIRLVSATELAEKAELILFAIIWEEHECLTEHLTWRRDIILDHPDVEKASSALAGERCVLAIKVRRRRMESAYGAALAAFSVAKDCKNVSKVSFVGAPFGCGTICILAPGSEDVVVFDKFEADDDESMLKSKEGLPNRMLLNWSYKAEGAGINFNLERIPLVTGRGRINTFKELPIQFSMYEWEAHGLLEARSVMEKSAP